MSTYKRSPPPDSEEHSAKRRALSAGGSSARSPTSSGHDSNSDTPMTSDGFDEVSNGQLLDGSHSTTSDAFQGNTTRLEICFGMIVGASLAPLPLGRAATVLAKELSILSASQLPLKLRVRADAVTLLLPTSPTSQECGVLDSNTARVLMILIKDNLSLEFEAFPDQEQAQGPSGSSILPLSITVYGPAASLDKAGFALSEARIFLQEPTRFHPSSVYCNPHFLSWNDDTRTPQLRQSHPLYLIDIAAEVQEIFNPSRTVKVPQWSGQDGRIRTILHKSVLPGRTLGVPFADLTLISSHQLAALQFMTAREEEYVRDETFSLWKRQWRSDGDIYVHSVTNVEQLTKPCEARGGLLADEMGTGKSLTLLALVVHTLDKARELPYSSSATQPQNPCSRATLIITPKSTLYNWELEIKKHIVPDVVRIHLYHGTGTLAETTFLGNCDVVLTTYETASLDRAKGGFLQRIQWFRIVLDEAHQIRNRSTKTFQAVTSLQAQRRWCLTGTPVQNKLEDLFSLTEFLRFYPVDNPSNTRRYVLDPLGRKEQRGLTSLRSIMTILALRRAKVACHSRGRSERIELVRLSPEEREKYNLLLVQAKRMRSSTTRETLSHIVLRTLIKLRQICSHGTLSPVLDTRIRAQNSGEELNCGRCGDPLDSGAIQIDAVRQVRRFPLCHDCSLSWTDNSPDSPLQYSSEDEWNYPIHDSSTMEQTASIGAELSDDYYNGSIMDRSKSRTNLDEKSSKLDKVLLNLIHLQQAFHGDQTPVKSLVFSCWTTTLTCLGLALARRGMDFVRIDGGQSLEDRALNLDRFKSEPSLRIMLLSTGCGSVGLNLKAASHVHIVEPQWNPMVEAQAAARVDRLDQTRDVVIIRYIVEHSIEEKIQSRQKQKILSAKFSVSQMSKEHKNDMSDDLKDLEELL